MVQVQMASPHSLFMHIRRKIKRYRIDVSYSDPNVHAYSKRIHEKSSMYSQDVFVPLFDESPISWGVRHVYVSEYVYVADVKKGFVVLPSILSTVSNACNDFSTVCVCLNVCMRQSSRFCCCCCCCCW